MGPHAKGRAIAGGERHRGFTLIELMIAVAIVAILTMIAYPSYTSHLRKGHRSEAQAYMMDIAQREQQYFTDNRSFAVDGATTAAAQLSASPPPADLTSYYTITTTVPPGTATPSFVITATPVAGSSQASDGSLSIDNTGAKTPSGNW